MFEALIGRVERQAGARARVVAQDLAGRLGDLNPDDVSVAPDGEGVRLSGRALSRRLAIDPELRWLVAGALRP